MRYVVLVLLSIALLGLAAPFVSVRPYRSQIVRSLESALGRPVEIGTIHYTLFSGPGFSMENVTIGEDPRYGIEPCAYVKTLVARVRLDKLLEGKIQFAALSLSSPTLNLVKKSDGTWNVVEVVQRLGQQGVTSWGVVPAIEITGARINFKFGNRKATFYVDDADIAAYPELTGKVRIRFDGSPSRSDQSGHDFGTIRGEANWYLKSSLRERNRLEAQLALDPSDLAEAVSLIEGYDIGVHGSVSARLRISGPEDDLRLQGQLHLEDVHRWDLFPASGEHWDVQYQGRMDLLEHNIQLDTVTSSAGAPAPVALQVRLNNVLTEPSWSVLAQLHQAPVERLLPLAQRMGFEFPPGMSATGVVDGAIGYSNRSGWNGGLALNNVSASLPHAPPLTAPSITLNIANDRVHILPSVINVQPDSPVQLSGDYTVVSRDLSLHLTATDFPSQSLVAAATPWFGTPPLFSELRGGTVSGQLTYASLPPETPSWSGDFQIANGSLQPHGIAEPVRDINAHVALSDGQVSVRRFSALIDQQLVTGDYHYNPTALRKERLTVQTSRLNLDDLEQFLGPALGPQGFFSRFHLGRRVLPGWLQQRSLEADAVVDRVSLAGNELGALRAHLAWIGPSIQFSSLQITLPEGRLRGRGLVNLASTRPRYTFTGELINFPWKDGAVEIRGDLSTSGRGQELLQNLRASGSFAGRSIAASPGIIFSKVNGFYTLSLESGWPRLELERVQAERTEEVWQGNGSSNRDGTLVLDLANGAQQMHVESTLSPLPPNASVSVATENARK